MFIPNSNNYNNNNNQPQLKVTKSLYIVIVLGQLPFTLFIEMAQTWAVQRDSVNTAIIHSYSTLPRNGRIHGLNYNYRYIQGFRTSRFCSRAGSEDRGPNRPGRKSWSRSPKTVVGCLKPSCVVCPTLTGPVFRYAHLVPKGSKAICRETLGKFPSATLSVVDIFSRPIFPEMTQYWTKWYRKSILSRTWQQPCQDSNSSPLVYSQMLCSKQDIQIHSHVIYILINY